jgi:RNA polymerase sigma factor (sigma-70 family)
MVQTENEDDATRRTLLSRLKNWDDHDSWNEFFNRYWRVIYAMAIRAGLTDAEAQDVVQETIISVSKSMPKFRYDPKVGSFKTWLLNVTHWRILDQFRKRDPASQQSVRSSSDMPQTATVDKIPEALPDLEGAWNEQWQKNLFTAATESIKTKVDPVQYQLFDLYVLKNWPISKIKENLRVSAGRIYLAKHRISRLIMKEVRRLEAQFVEVP